MTEQPARQENSRRLVTIAAIVAGLLALGLVGAKLFEKQIFIYGCETKSYNLIKISLFFNKNLVNEREISSNSSYSLRLFKSGSSTEIIDLLVNSQTIDKEISIEMLRHVAKIYEFLLAKKNPKLEELRKTYFSMAEKLVKQGARAENIHISEYFIVENDAIFLKLLLQNGAMLPEILCSKPLLHTACSEGNIEAVEILLKYNAQLISQHDLERFETSNDPTHREAAALIRAAYPEHYASAP